LVQGSNRCSGSYSVPDQTGNVDGMSLHQDHQGSVTQFLDNMCSLALGCAYSAPNLQLGQGSVAPPSDSCITDEARKETSNVFNGENNLKLTENEKMKSYHDEYGHNLLPSALQGPMVHTKAEMSDHNTNFLWPDHKSNSLPALIPACGSPRSNPFSGPSDLGSNESSSSMVNNNNNGNYGGSLVPPELLLDFTENSNTAKPNASVGLTAGSTQLWSDLNSEDGRDYWSNMLKLVDTIPAGLEHIIRPVQSE